MEALLAQPGTWETFLVYHKLNLQEIESVSGESIILASYVFMGLEWAVWAHRGR